MYNAKGLRSVRFVVPMKETVRLDLGKKAERRIREFGEEPVNWCKESEKDGKERCLIFHIFSNIGWLMVEIPFLGEDAFQLLTSFLVSEITLEALKILQNACRHPNYKSTITISNLCSFIIKILDCKNHKLLEPASEILFDLSLYRELSSHIISSGCIQKLVHLMNNGRFAEHCIKILRNLSVIKEALVLIAETDGCITSIAELLETGSREEQEHAMAMVILRGRRTL